MGPTIVTIRWPARFWAGIVAGVVIAAVDNFAFEGEISPLVIVAMLLAVTAAAGIKWGRHGWIAAAVAWVCLPLAHWFKHLFGLPDTLNPNTYTSILMLAAFSLAVATIGTGCGMLIHRLRPLPPRTFD